MRPRAGTVVDVVGAFLAVLIAALLSLVALAGCVVVTVWVLRAMGVIG